MAFKFLKNYLSYQLSTLVGGRKNYFEEKNKSSSLQQVKIINKNLAKLLGNESNNQEGILTYSEFLAIEQFGKFGYHATHKEYGETPTYQYWPKALVQLCKNNNIDTILEIGPGQGKLGLNALKEAQKQGKTFYWAGVEISQKLQKQVRQNFAKAGLSKRIVGLSDSIENISLKKKVLVVFSYSLDSIPPEILTNTKSQISYPNRMIGIHVQNSFAKERYVSSKELEKKGFSFKKTLLTYKSRHFKLDKWQLYPNQRVYLPVKALTFLLNTIQKVKENSLLVIIDEFSRPPFVWQTQHLLLPKDLGLFDRDQRKIDISLATAGEHLLYFPCFLDTYLRLLEDAGISNIVFAEEHIAAKYLQTNATLPVSMSHMSLCYAIVGKVKRKRIISAISLIFPTIERA